MIIQWPCRTFPAIAKRTEGWQIPSFGLITPPTCNNQFYWQNETQIDVMPANTTERFVIMQRKKLRDIYIYKNIKIKILNLTDFILLIIVCRVSDLINCSLTQSNKRSPRLFPPQTCIEQGGRKCLLERDPLRFKNIF